MICHDWMVLKPKQATSKYNYVYVCFYQVVTSKKCNLEKNKCCLVVTLDYSFFKGRFLCIIKLIIQINWLKTLPGKVFQLQAYIEIAHHRELFRTSKRRERDSNPRTFDSQRFSRPPRSTTLPSLRGKNRKAASHSQSFF